MTKTSRGRRARVVARRTGDTQITIANGFASSRTSGHVGQEFQSGWCIGTVWEDLYMQTLFTIDPCEACEVRRIFHAQGPVTGILVLPPLRSLIARLF